MPGLNNNLLAQHLNQQLDGTVYSDQQTLHRYSTDKSIYQVVPQMVVCPASMEDLNTIVTTAIDENLSITARGGGSGTAGAALGDGIVIHFPRHGFLGNIIDFTTEGDKGYITVEAGVYHDAVQSFLKDEGYYLPADPSSAPLCQIGGNIATKASGPHGFSHGSIDKFLEGVEYISASGELINSTKTHTVPPTLIAALGQLEKQINKDNQTVALLKKRQHFKTASGYNLFSLINQQQPLKVLSQLFAGSVGTLGIVTQATLRVEPYIPKKTTLLFYFDSLHSLSIATQLAIAADVTAIEVISRATIKLLKKRKGAGSDELHDGHLLFIECEGEMRHEKLAKIQAQLRKNSVELMIPAQRAETEEEQKKLWQVRKQILPILLRPGAGMKALSIVNDVGVPPEHLANFIEDIEAFFTSHDLETVIFGHAGNGNLHLRPLINVEAADLKRRIQAIADRVYEIVFRYNGTITAEHAMGRLRTPYLEREWGSTIYSYMKDIKNIFDPDSILNPEAMFGQGAITDHLRHDLFTTNR